jgi:hypothetical protein
MGKNIHAHTPVLDTMQDRLESGQRSFGEAVSSYFQCLPWNPVVVLSIGVILVILGMMMLRV